MSSAFCLALCLAYLTLSRELDIKQMDYTYVEKEFAELLQELDRVESIIAAMLKAFLEIKRTQVHPVSSRLSPPPR